MIGVEGVGVILPDAGDGSVLVVVVSPRIPPWPDWWAEAA